MEPFMIHEELQRFGSQIPVVPWLCGDHDTTKIRELGPFASYPLDRGWTLEEVQKPHEVLQSDPSRALPMLQAWLLFGVLEGATMFRWESEIQERLKRQGYRGFLEPGPQGKVVCYQPLNGLSGVWGVVLERTQHSKAERQRRFRETLGDAQNLIMALATLRDDGDLEVNTDQLTMLDSIIRYSVILLEMLIETAPEFLTKGQGLIGFQSKVPETVWEHLRSRFQRNGWCPSTLSTFRSRYGSYSFIEYASYFQATDQPFSKHSLCGEERCMANNVDVDHCSASHVTPDCQCNFLRPSLDDIREISTTGGIPVLGYGLKVTRSTVNGQPVYQIGPGYGLNVSEHHAGWKMLAVSHVWSDGLMGTTETGLPECQIRKIDNIMKALEMDCFWIDALAIPSERGLRKNAISKMSQVYSLANRTVILDKGLQRLDPAMNSRGDVLLRILSSVWIQRLWTLQEVVLSQDPYIMFRETLIPLSQFHNDMFEMLSQRPSPLTSVFTREMSLLRGLRYSNLTIGRISRILSSRDSSRKDDESLAIASLMKIDVSSLLNVSGEERMRIFWLQLAQVPRNIILTGHPRMSLEGFHALPRRLLGIQSRQLLGHENTDVARVTEHGLQGNYWIYDFEEMVSISSSYNEPIYDANNERILQIYKFRQQRDENTGFDAVIMVNEVTAQWPIERGVLVLKTGEAHGDIPVYSFLGPCEVSIPGTNGIPPDGKFPEEQIERMRAFACYEQEMIIA